MESGEVTCYRYDKNSNLKEVVDAEIYAREGEIGARYQITYDLFGRIEEIQSPKKELISKESYEKLIEEHQKKLNDYMKDPYGYDNKGILENAPSQEIRDKIIQGRINALQKQINKQQGELEKIIDLLRERGISN